MNLKARLEKLSMDSLRQVGYDLERVFHDGRQVRATSREKLLSEVEDAFAEFLDVDPDGYAALLAEHELDVDSDAEGLVESDALDGREREEAAVESVEPEGDPAIDGDEDDEADAGDIDSDQPSSTLAERKGPYAYVVVAAYGFDAELPYGTIVPDPKPKLYDVCPHAVITSEQAQKMYRETRAHISTDRRYSHGHHEAWSRRAEE